MIVDLLEVPYLGLNFLGLVLLLCVGFLDSIHPLMLDFIGLQRFGVMGFEIMGKKMDTFGNLEDLRGW